MPCTTHCACLGSCRSTRRPRGPFLPDEPARRLGLGVAVVADTLARLEVAGRVVQGEFRPGGSGREWLDAEVLRRLRRRSLAALRKEVEPVAQDALARFLLAWQGVGTAGPARSTARVQPWTAGPALRGGRGGLGRGE